MRADLRRDTIPGVFLHAAAVANLLRGDSWVPVPWPGRAALLLALASATSLTVISLPLVGDATAQACGEAIVFRQIDTVAVKGRERPVGLFEPLGPAGEAAADALARRAAFATALRLWRRGSFAEAASAFETLAGGDPAAARFSALAREFAANPPGDWRGVSILTDT